LLHLLHKSLFSLLPYRPIKSCPGDFVAHLRYMLFTDVSRTSDETPSQA
jgi:hypothetical protein